LNTNFQALFESLVLFFLKFMVRVGIVMKNFEVIMFCLFQNNITLKVDKISSKVKLFNKISSKVALG
jgi:hypothetical protein